VVAHGIVFTFLLPSSPPPSGSRGAGRGTSGIRRPHLGGLLQRSLVELDVTDLPSPARVRLSLSARRHHSRGGDRRGAPGGSPV